MGHCRTTVDNDPLTIVFTLDARFGKTVLAHLVSHARGQGLGLSIRGAAGNDHPLKEGGQVFGIEDTDVLRFDVFQSIDHHTLEFLYVFFFCSFSHEFER